MQDGQGYGESQRPGDPGSEHGGADQGQEQRGHSEPEQAQADLPGHQPDSGPSIPDQPWQAPRDSESGFGPPGYGAPEYGQPGYGQPEYGQPGYGQPGGYLPPPGARTRRGRTLLTYLAVAALAAATGAGVTGYLLSGQPSSPAASGQPSTGTGGGFPGGFPSGNTGGAISGADERAAVNAVRPGLVDISSNLSYQGSQAAATGMVISSDGLVLTNNHVITDTTALYATVVATGQRFAARWLGYDQADDVAVIKLINAHNLRTVPLGDSSAVKVGDRVIAIGNAYGAGRAPAVAGSITGLNRSITASDSGAQTSERLHGMLQTNAGIVQGDSGGPLVSAAGRVIGMDTAAATGSFGDGTQNVGFAIPINKALAIARQIIAGKPSPTIRIGASGFMGVLVPYGAASQVASPRQQRLLQLQQDEGGSAFPVQPSSPACLQNDQNAGVPAKVAPVAAGALIIGELCSTPAAAAGLTAGDVIISVGGQPVTSPKQLTSIMQGFRPGMSVRVTWADVSGQRHVSSLILIDAPPH